MESSLKAFFSITVFALMVMAYFLPSIIGFNRKHQNATAIFMLDLFLGWSFIGWVIAMIWSCTHVKKDSLTVEDLVKINLSNAKIVPETKKVGEI